MRTQPLTWLVVIGLLIPVLNANGQQRRSAFKKAFAKLSTNYKQSLKKPGTTAKRYKYQVPGGKTASVSAGKFDIDPVDNPIPGKPDSQIAVKIWGQLADAQGRPNGPLINLVKHKWQRQERFYLWFESAVPLTLSLFQNYPDNTRVSRQVSPNDKYPRSFETIQPGRPWMFPLRLKMDDSLNDEQMSIVFARSDLDQLPVNDAGSGLSPSTNPPQIVDDGGSTKGDGGSIKFARALQKSLTTLNKTATKAKQYRGKSTKFDIDGPPPAAPAESTRPDDVTFYCFGAGLLGQIELTLKKD